MTSVFHCKAFTPTHLLHTADFLAHEPSCGGTTGAPGGNRGQIGFMGALPVSSMMGSATGRPPPEKPTYKAGAFLLVWDLWVPFSVSEFLYSLSLSAQATQGDTNIFRLHLLEPDLTWIELTFGFHQGAFFLCRCQCLPVSPVLVPPSVL